LTIDAFRCSDASEGRDEPLHGTASFVRRWLLLEQPGPWGRNALMESRIPKQKARELWKRARAAGVRIVLVRRGVRQASKTRQCYFARTDDRGMELSHLALDSFEALLEVDLAPLREGTPIVGATTRTEPLFLVCTHGRHDACCSIRGNPVSRLACAVPGMEAWECSHIGGDRFAANLVCFPHGIYYGRVALHDVVPLMRDYAEGTISLDHYRGRCCYPFAVQAAEYFARRESRTVAVDGVALVGHSVTDRGLIASFAIGKERRAEVEVRVGELPGTHRLTCHAIRTDPIPRYELASFTLHDVSL
jgi:hypothetical protein